MSMTTLHYEWAACLPSISKIVPEVLEEIYRRLRGPYLKTPTSRGGVVRDGKFTTQLDAITSIPAFTGRRMKLKESVNEYYTQTW